MMAAQPTYVPRSVPLRIPRLCLPIAGPDASQMVDLEIQSATAVKAGEVQRLRNRAALILSYHDFRGTKKLDETFAKMRAFPADYYKIVGTATSLHDNVVLMKFLEHN